ncbi:putative cytochrome P450 [Hibiscus syriacus]|uniref:Condensin-1 complex subunit CAP-D2 n=1 Tax=Hibiscus syriacus TaxID=106335 RepID=A0A6A3CNJ9_HIBSY|nr:putative cytochrome P450 [Hibiscus syriacus]
MAPHFLFPPNLQALEKVEEQEDYQDNRLFVQNAIDVSNFRASELEGFVKGVSFDLSDKELYCIEDQDVFDRVYSSVRGFSSLTPSCKSILAESLRSNFSVLLPNVDSLVRVSQAQNDDETPMLDRVTSYRNAFKIYSFFLFHIILTEESNTGSSNNVKVTASTRKKQTVNSWNWEWQRGRMLNLIANSLEINISLLFGSSDPDENYLSFVVKNAFSMFEKATLLKDSETKNAVSYHWVLRYKKYADGTLACSLIREVGRTNPKSYVKDTAGAENIGRFLVELADRLPKLVSTNIGLLIPHFGGESYKIRNALVAVLGKLVAKAFKDVEGEVSSKSIRLQTKQAMLEILLERCRDISAYTRSRALQVWAELCEEHSVSIGLWNEVAAVAAGRLEDKSAFVRKSALNLLIMMLQHNPFGPQLRIASFKATLEQYKKKLNELEPVKTAEGMSDGVPSDNDLSNGEVDNGNAEEVTNYQPENLVDSLADTEQEVPSKDSPVPDVGNLKQTKALVASLEAGLKFSECISATMPTLLQLMASSSATDVENTILLLMRCRQFQIDGAEACLRKMLPLVFSQDKSIYEAVENAFVTIYITKSLVETAKNLLNLAIDSNVGDQASLEFIVGALVSKGDISSGVISALWDFFCFNVNGTTAEQCRGALAILCMAAKSSSAILGSHLQDIIDIGFGRWAKVEPLLARTACIAIQRLSNEDKKKLVLSNGSRVFSILESLITGLGLPDNIWYAAADKAIDHGFQNRTVFCGRRGDALHNDIVSGNSTALPTVQVAKLSRYLFVTSHVAMNQLVYIESCVRKIQKQKGNKEKVDSEGTENAETQKDNNINAELGLAASEDAILDTLAERAEKEIVCGSSSEKNLIGECAPFLSKLCRNFVLMQKYPLLQASAMLALCRFMIIDAKFCDENLQLLFTVVENAPSETVRSNCTIALGDLAVRFPNLLEPWTENMYARLKDPSVSVRKNAVLVLSHLILNDMMKVKGYVNEMAIRVEDNDERISSLAKLFFHELSKKGSNPIYNLLPDILGKLSTQDLQKDSFYNIMQFLIGSIKKDKQMESLVEKLCNRSLILLTKWFVFVADVVQWENISYCLSQLSFTEKGVKRLIESFKTYEHALFEDSVVDHFRNVINKSKKFAKPELKVCIEEFEEKLNKFHNERKEQEVTAKKAELHRQKVANVETFVTNANDGEESAESEVAEGVSDGEVANTSTEEETETPNDEPRHELVEPDEPSGASSEVTEQEEETEVQSSRVERRGALRSRATRSHVKDLKTPLPATTQRIIRSRRKVGSIVSCTILSYEFSKGLFTLLMGEGVRMACRQRIGFG